MAYQSYYVHAKKAVDAQLNLSHIEGVWRIDVDRDYQYKRGADAAISRLIDLSNVPASELDIVATTRPPVFNLDAKQDLLTDNEPDTDRGVTKISKIYGRSVFEQPGLASNHWHKVIEDIPVNLLRPGEADSPVMH